NKPLLREEGLNPIEIQRKMHLISDKKIGLIKNKNLLEEAISELDNLLTKQVDKLCAAPLKTKILNFNWMRSLELENMLTCLYLSARSSIIREERMIIG
ncbi:MAG: hypothetical protein ACTSSM_15795, partial [Promethearchaeota archaeon]